jgi:hypothetical protein
MIEEIDAGLLSTGMKYTGCVYEPLPPGEVTVPDGDGEGDADGDELGLCDGEALGDGELPVTDGDGDGEPPDPAGPVSARSSA